MESFLYGTAIPPSTILWERWWRARWSWKSVKDTYPYLNRHWCAGRIDSGVERTMVKELGKFTPYVRKKEGPIPGSQKIVAGDWLLKPQVSAKSKDEV